ncbi:tyrosine-type recombinase/integrase [uncultured Eubacterium sp.]|uniref:tyrosine-type recombinase/integrase n=1 Tax=uncultured Eubacterium sp. TaxID=165185 RepID=UPI0025ED2775|nr:tyrosine-type recombinase/integrase [uncultured Eubacterium sp.]
MLSNYVNSFYKKRKDKLIFTRNDNFITVSQVNSYYKRLITRYKISDTADDFNQHQLRHTYVTRSIESGISAKVLQKKLGHTNIKVTMNTYADIFPQFEDEKLTKYLQSNNLA